MELLALRPDSFEQPAMVLLLAYTPPMTVSSNVGAICSLYVRHCIFTYSMDVSDSLTFTSRTMARAVIRASLAAKAWVHPSQACQIHG
jgi:hypothetical protein